MSDKPYVLIASGWSGGQAMRAEQVGSLPLTLRSHIRLLNLAIRKVKVAHIQIRNRHNGEDELLDAKVVRQEDFKVGMTYDDI